MYTLMTREYLNGDLMAPRLEDYSSAKDLAQVLNNFDYSRHWRNIEAREDDRIIYSWRRRDYASFTDSIDVLRYQLGVLANALTTHAHKTITADEGSTMINTTIMALNCGFEEAMHEAYSIKLCVIVSGDLELIKKIEYLWDVI